MSSGRSACKEAVREAIERASGAYKVGFARATAVDDVDARRYEAWTASGRHAAMDYLERNGAVRRDPRLLLEGARTVVSCAFNYHTGARAAEGCVEIAEYALGDDYHEVVKARLRRAAEAMTSLRGGEWRVCVDTAPLRERYWAVKAGIGFTGVNNQLIIPGAGSRFFLGEILTTAEIEPDEVCTATCDGCGLCVEACPGGALSADGSGVDARRCVSYLTIEHRGDLPEDFDGGMRLYGCDECQRVCPHNAQSPVTDIDEFGARERLTRLTPDDVMAMEREEYTALLRHSAIKRAKLEGLKRNCWAILRRK